jgi:prepilin-type N-terminal cleavage/methylation domain-containing protein
MNNGVIDISRYRDRRGFTLIEILVAISLLVIIVGIVYASFSTVIYATEQARLSSDELRLRQFLTRQFQENFASLYADVALIDENSAFIGASEDGSNGPMDWVEFSAMSPLMGGLSPPGMIKRVSYAGSTSNDSGMQLGSLVGDGDTYANGPQLEASEWLLVNGETDEEGDRSGFNFKEESDSMQFSDIDSPGWSVPISSIDFSFFDGAEWVEEWDSYAENRLPWAVRIRINFAKTENEREAESDAGYDSVLDADFELVIPLPIAAGYFTYGADWEGLNITMQQDENTDGNGDGKDGNKGDNKGDSKGDSKQNNLKSAVVGQKSGIFDSKESE